MKDYVIISETNTDLTEKMAKDLGVSLIPMKFVFDGVTYDNKDISVKEFYEKLKNGEIPTTVQVNSAEFVEFFEPFLQEGKDILYIAFSSGLSGTYQASTIAKAELEEKYPGSKIMIVDSLAASMGEGLIVYYAAKLKEKGEDITFVYNWLETNVLKTAHFFTVNDLFFLKKGGRVSTAAAVFGSVLGIKPILNVDNEGHLIPIGKVRGRKQSLDALVAKYEEFAINPKDQVVFISHGDCLDDAKYVAEKIKKFGCKEVVVEFIGPVIGAHSGPGTVALFFMAKNR